VNIARSPAELAPEPRAVAIGTFDGVHLGHRRVLASLLSASRRPTVLTFHPHPRTVLGRPVELLTTVDRRLELLADVGVADVLLIEFDLEFSQLAPEAFAESYLRAIGTEVVVAGPSFRFGHRRSGDVGLLRRLGFDVRTAALVDGVSSSAIRALVRAGDVERAAAALGRPAEIDGTVVAGHARGRRLGFRTANVAVPPDLLVPAFGVYAGSALGHRAAISIGVNPHYGGGDAGVEAFLLDFDGDLYGRRLVVELWKRLRDEQAFANEEALVAQIERDVADTRAAVRPSA
jgi:riboflavin kinase/FMN adenylyltransferase